MNNIKNKEEMAYLRLLKNVMVHGEEKSDRTNTGTYSIFSPDSLRFSLKDGKLPVLTTKKVFTKGAIHETLFFLKGETDSKKLESVGVNIWKQNTTREFLDNRGLHNLSEGDIGPIYGFQWRYGFGTDQIANAIELIKNDPHSRRIIITALNPSQKGVLDPCHTFFQFYVSNNNELSCHLYMRSVDLFLGFPLNAVSYALITHIIAKATNTEAKELIITFGDAHVYKNHIDQVEGQMNRIPFEFPTLTINKDINSIQDIEKLQYEDFQINDYKCHPAIKAPMAV